MNPVPTDHHRTPPAGEASCKFLSFELGAETYGIDIRQVQEVRSYERPTPLPHASAWFLGVTKLRGDIVPVVDLRMRMGVAANFDGRTVTAVLNLGARTVGVVVDAVSDVVELASASIRPAPSGTSADDSAVRGFADLQEDGAARLLILLDTGTLLGDLAGGAPRVPQPAHAH